MKRGKKEIKLKIERTGGRGREGKKEIGEKRQRETM